MRPGVGENTVDVWLIDWEHPEKNHFAIAEEVTVAAADDRAHGKRPDVVLYVNGIALGVLELKRSTISVAEGMRLMDKHLPLWRQQREELNAAPLAHAEWSY